MKIKILHYIPDAKGKRQGYVDFKVDYADNKFEIFRNAVYFSDGIRRWTNLGSVLRNDKWLSRYERSGDFNEMKVIDDEFTSS